MRETGFWTAALVAVLAVGLSEVASAEDWGLYSLVPASATGLALEATGAEDGAVVSIGKPALTAHQKWMIVPKSEGFFAIRLASSKNLVLAAAKGGTKEGTSIVLEADQDKPSQQWWLQKHDNGSYSLLARHGEALGLDHFGGNPNPGARLDLWAYYAGDTHYANDTHLQWMI